MRLQLKFHTNASRDKMMKVILLQNEIDLLLSWRGGLLTFLLDAGPWPRCIVIFFHLTRRFRLPTCLVDAETSVSRLNATSLNIFMGFVLVHFQKYKLLK